MAANEFMPWRDTTELLQVRDWLYLIPHAKDDEKRRKACSLISAWKLRGNLPHAVESTALLKEAAMIDNQDTQSINSIRLCYVGALCRFVTGLVDSGQDGSHRISMYNKAHDIGLPAALVELRHEATHGDIPSLVVLRSAAQRSLQWLYVDYWQRLVPKAASEEPKASANSSGKLGHELIASLHKYQQYAVHEHRKDPKTYQTILRDSAAKASAEVEEICQKKGIEMTELAEVLVGEGFLIPKGKQLYQPVEDFFPLWDHLIKKLSKHQSCFLEILIEAMASRISILTIEGTSTDRYNEVICTWLERIFTSKLYRPVLKPVKVDYSGILSACLNSPNPWTIRLVKSIIEAPGKDLEKVIYGAKLEDFLQGSTESCRSSSAAPTSDEFNGQRAGNEELGNSNFSADPDTPTNIAIHQDNHTKDASRSDMSAARTSGNDGTWSAADKTIACAAELVGEDAQIGGWQRLRHRWYPKPIGMI